MHDQIQQRSKQSRGGGTHQHLAACRINEGERLSASRAQVLSLEQAVQRVQMAIAKGFEELEGRAQVREVESKLPLRCK